MLYYERMSKMHKWYSVLRLYPPHLPPLHSPISTEWVQTLQWKEMLFHVAGDGCHLSMQLPLSQSLHYWHNTKLPVLRCRQVRCHTWLILSRCFCALSLSCSWNKCKFFLWVAQVKSRRKVNHHNGCNDINDDNSDRWHFLYNFLYNFLSTGSLSPFFMPSGANKARHRKPKDWG
jgi:hypothetical protein